MDEICDFKSKQTIIIVLLPTNETYQNLVENTKYQLNLSVLFIFLFQMKLKLSNYGVHTRICLLVQNMRGKFCSRPLRHRVTR